VSEAVLISTISDRVKRADTQSLDISFNELLSMVQENELFITPDYQRLFRWSEGQRSRFIESLILEMPVPPIFVIEENDGRYQLIDGLQRISSYLHLRGELEAPHLQSPVKRGEKLVFSDCDIVKELDGLNFDKLPTSIQIRLKRSFIRVEVVRKGTDPHFKYHMFKRLNTGGESLSPQQVRNCTVRMLSNKFPDFIIELSDFPSYKTCTDALTEERMLSAVDQEHVLRFFALKNRRWRFKHQVSDFLTEYMEDVAEEKELFDYDIERSVFEKTFSMLERSLGEKAFSFSNKKGNDLAAGFSLYHFESISIGLQAILDKLSLESNQMERLSVVLRGIKLDQRFKEITTGGGKNSPGPLNDRIGFVERALCDAFG
jgi:hypothetical protein